MSAAEHLAEAIDVGCSRDDHDHIGDHRREVLLEAADAVDAGKLSFPEDVRGGASWAARMLRRMADEEGEGTGTTGGEPTPTAGIGDERALLLADHILHVGGTWASGRAHRWMTEDAGLAVTARHVRRMLKSLAAYGYLTEHDQPGRVSYTPRYATGGGR